MADGTGTDSTDIREILISRGLLPDAAQERLRRLEQDSGERIDRIASKLGLISDQDLAGAYAAFLGSPLLTPEAFPDEPVATDRIRPAFLKRARMIPLTDDADVVTIAMADPLDRAACRAVGFATGKRVAVRVALPVDIDAAYDRLYGEGRSAIDQIYDAAGEREDTDRDADLERLKDLASEAPVIRLVNSLITRAVEMRASDIHLESTETGLRVRYRVDGVLRVMDAPPARLRSAIISRIKIMAKLNIAERRLAQDGRIRLAVRGKEID
ncbi:MAG: GspE/PulE family protein, partial [Acetobacteraceae bacterium]